MSKAGIALAVFFLGIAAVQMTGVLEREPQAAPPPPPPATMPSASPDPTPTKVKLEPFPRFTGPSPKAKFYKSSEELAAALAKKGIECTSLNPLDQPDPTLKEFYLCDVGAPERRFNIYLLPGIANRNLWVTNMKHQKLALPIVYGPNWIVVAAGDPDTAMKRVKAVAGAIGGEVRDFSPKGKKKG